MPQSISTGTFCEAKWVVSGTAGQGTHTTISAALTAASSGDTIFIRPGTYTENLTLKAGVNITAFPCDSQETTGSVIIAGKATATFAGSCAISDVILKTNGDYVLEITGASATVVDLYGCFLWGFDFSVIHNTNAASFLTINACAGDLSTTGIAYFVITAGTTNFNGCILDNSGSSVTASTISAGSLGLNLVNITNAITTSSTGNVNAQFCVFNAPIILAGTNSFTCDRSILNGASASSVSIGAGCTGNLSACTINSSNTNAITGAGTLNFGNLVFIGGSNTINTTTQVPYVTDLGRYKSTLQPAFSASLSGNVVNATGDGTTYTIAFDTEQFDQGANFGSNTFTAPIAGKYVFPYQISLANLGAAHTDALVTVSGVNTIRVNAFASASASGILTLSGCVFVSMAASATATMAITVSGGTKTVTVVGNTSGCRYEGYLAC